MLLSLICFLTVRSLLQFRLLSVFNFSICFFRPSRQTIHRNLFLFTRSKVLDLHLLVFEFFRSDDRTILCSEAIRVLEDPLRLSCFFQHQFYLLTRFSQRGGHLNGGRIQIRSHGKDNRIDSGRFKGGQKVSVLEQFHNDGVSKAKTGGRCWVAPKRLKQFIVSATSSDRPEDTLSIKRFEDGSRVIRESTNHGGIEKNPIFDSVDLAQFQQVSDLVNGLRVFPENFANALNGIDCQDTR
mmetsp:Transcript_197/g.574  ORF Transcript_197/g.574 Transcript_197/m.574 type:complete len:240 (-) Transcript_197:1217-1936(-)